MYKLMRVKPLCFTVRVYDTHPVVESQHEPVSADAEPSGEGVATHPCCIVCGSRRFFSLQGIEDPSLDLLVCRLCGTGRVHPFPDRAQLKIIYSDEYYGGENDGKFRPFLEPIVQRVSAWKAQRLAKGLPPGSRILDLGCGRGTMLGTFANLGLEVHGVEVSERAARGADSRAEIHIAERLSDVRLTSESFDRVVIWHVLEHLVNPRETLLEVHRILKPSGQVVIAVPNFSSLQARWAGPVWFHLDLPRHLHHFPLEALRNLIEGCGLRCHATRHFSFRQNPFGWVQSAVNRFGRFPINGLYRMLQGSPKADSESPMNRISLMALFCVGMPAALVLSAVTALLRNGATVSVRAEKCPPVE